jgi:hypothetical protein
MTDLSRIRYRGLAEGRHSFRLTSLDAAVEDVVPELCELPGAGSVVAACVLTAWSHPGRVRSEAGFAALAGTCPIPASSGNTLRHRLNRGGDRRLNRALTTIALVRMRTHAPTRIYVARRRAEGRTTKEIMRSIKRYITLTTPIPDDQLLTAELTRLDRKIEAAETASTWAGSSNSPKCNAAPPKSPPVEKS